MPADRDNLYVKPEFEALSLPVGEEEERLLLESLESDGCREPIYVLANDGAILDGHRRFRICSDQKITFKTKALKFGTEQEAINWIVQEQLAKRSLTAEQKSYLRGKRYLAEVNPNGRPCENTGKNEGKKGETVSPFSGKTDERLAAEYGVDERTMRNDAVFAKSIDALAEVVPEAKETILAGKADATRSEVKKAATLPKKERRKAAKAIAAGKPTAKPSKNGAAIASFNGLYEYIGKTAPRIDSLAKVHPADKFARRLQNYVEEALKIVNDWKSACR